MKTATILGAGYMGSAMVFPLTERGFRVRLWGTWLDDELIQSSRHGDHPRLEKRLPESVELFESADLESAASGADVVFVGVSSQGFVPVFERLLSHMTANLCVVALTKGFTEVDGAVRRVSQAALQLYSRRFPRERLRWTSIGGPVKAYELARGVPSPAIYAGHPEETASLAEAVQTDTYRIRTTTDVAGVELCSALKNVYSVAIGLCDGLYQKKMPRNYHNLSSLLFNQALREISVIAAAEGGRVETVHDLAGVGDLYVTAQSGKNQRYGELVGQGMTPEAAYQHMDDRGQLAEGYLALIAGHRWLRAGHAELLEELPLFRTLHQIVCEGTAVEETLLRMVRNLGS